MSTAKTILIIETVDTYIPYYKSFHCLVHNLLVQLFAKIDSRYVPIVSVSGVIFK